MFKLSIASQANLQGVNQKLIDVVELALNISNVDFGIPKTGGFRTEEQQKALHNAGKSQKDGYSRRSKHQFGLAVDVFAYVDGKASYDTGDLAEIATAMFEAAARLGVRLKWGGHWKSFKDYPHFEIKEK